ncbi:MAG: hypothetical protein RBR87_13510 [Bacteroidales bacterium]|jgi:REP element-mobilizing transposase RayT|nr:hypothetical protein [Bacteroidales bacterium]
MGVIADLMWREIKNHTKNITLGEFVVMPNHVQGLLILNGDGMGGADTNVVHNRINRKAQEFENIQNYIADNPENWEKDKFFGNK